MDRRSGVAHREGRYLRHPVLNQARANQFDDQPRYSDAYHLSVLGAHFCFITKTAQPPRRAEYLASHFPDWSNSWTM